MTGIVVLTAASMAAAPPPQSMTFGFERVTATAGDRVTVHAQGFRSTRAVRLYLVPSSIRRKIRSAFDTRLHYIAMLKPRRGHAMTTFTAPPLDTGSYEPWCAGCGLRATGRLRIETPAATADSCPVTVPTDTRPHMYGRRYGNGLLWAGVPRDGVLRLADSDRGGVLWTKLAWSASASGVYGYLTVSGQRLDAVSARMVVHRVNRGTDGRSWAAPVTFPTAGCWRVTARLVEFRFAIDLPYVVKVVPE